MSALLNSGDHILQWQKLNGAQMCCLELFARNLVCIQFQKIPAVQRHFVSKPVIIALNLCKKFFPWKKMLINVRVLTAPLPRWKNLYMCINI